jgi:ABC-type Mn2+/Zn2+ transport system permease subunit
MNQALAFIMEPWHFAFMQRGALAVIMVALCSAMIGCHVVLRKLSFVGDGLAHATFGGLAVGFLLKINLLFSATVAAVLTAIGIGTVSRKAEISLDTAIGIMFTGVFAAGIVIISHDRGYRGDLFDLLLGNVLTVSIDDLKLTAAALAVVVFCLLFFYKELLFASFDPLGAEASGIEVAWLDFALLLLLAVTVTVSLQTVGVILVSALLITPAASAYQLTNKFSTMMLYACIIGAFSGVAGIYLSYFLDVPCGAAVVLSATAIFFLCLIVSQKKGKVKIEETVEEPQPKVLGDFHPL